MADVPKPQLKMVSSPLSWGEQRLLNLLVNLGASASAAKGMGKEAWDVSTPGIATELYRKFKGEPNSLRDVPTKAAMFLLNFLGEPEGEIEGTSARMAPEFDWSKTSSVGAREGDAFVQAKQELFPGKRELSTQEIGKVSKRAAEIAAGRKAGGSLTDQIMEAIAKHPEGRENKIVPVRKLLEETPGLEKYGTEEGWYSDEVQQALGKLWDEGKITGSEYTDPGPQQGKIVGLRMNPAKAGGSVSSLTARESTANSIRDAAREAREAARAQAASRVDRRKRDRKTPKPTRVLREALGQ